jgi:hypothetical protein
LSLQPVQSRIKGPVLHLQEVIRRSLNMLADLMPMRRPVAERAENEHV